MSKCACGCGERVAQANCFRSKCPRPAGTSRDPEGKIKAANKISDAIWNPIRNGKRQKRAHEEAVKRIALMSKEAHHLGSGGRGGAGDHGVGRREHLHHGRHGGGVP